MFLPKRTNGKPYIISRRISQSQVFLMKNGGLKMLPGNVMTDTMMSIDPVDYGIILISSVIILLIFPVLLYWGWKKGQFKDLEEAKFRMLEMEEENGN
jgi:cbb3-type cytochrome oxidase maturation protein